MLYEDPTKEASSDERFHVELHFSPGVNCCVAKDLPPGPGFRPHSRNNEMTPQSQPSSFVISANCSESDLAKVLGEDPTVEGVASSQALAAASQAAASKAATYEGTAVEMPETDIFTKAEPEIVLEPMEKPVKRVSISEPIPMKPLQQSRTCVRRRCRWGPAASGEEVDDEDVVEKVNFAVFDRIFGRLSVMKDYLIDLKFNLMFFSEFKFYKFKSIFSRFNLICFIR